MANKDVYHDSVKRALEADGWRITHDPLTVAIGRREGYIDLGAEKVFAAEQNGRKIAVEVKSFIGPSLLQDLYLALGQYLLYREALLLVESDRVLYLAVRQSVYEQLEREQLGDLLERQKVKFLVFDAAEEKIVQWTT